jgi:hypothetical protein
MMDSDQPAYKNTMAWMDKVCPDLSAAVRSGKRTLMEAYIDAVRRFIPA